jgi:hypothetical protein
MKSAFFKDQYLAQAPQAVAPSVLTQQVQQELNQLLASLRKQVRNVVAVGQWLARQPQKAPADQVLAGQLPALQISRPEALSFQLKASPEAFALFAKALQRTNFYRHGQVQTDRQQQVVKIGVDFRDLGAWEYELSILFEQITPDAYLKSLLYGRQQGRLPARKAS